MRETIAHKMFILFSVFALLFSSFAPAQAQTDLPPGTVFKGKGHPTLYYLTDEGNRYVFPNAATYFSWYDNFDEVVEIDDEDLARYRLRGNVRYKPGALMVKIASDPKVYVVGANGHLRWVPTEQLARKLYGDNWNLLVDDVPVTFFLNYVVGDPVEDEEDFDADAEEEEIDTIDENRRAEIKKKIRKKINQRLDKVCNRLEHRFNKIQERLERRGIVIDGLGDDFLRRCVADDSDDSGDDDGDDKDTKRKKVTLCHLPRGNKDRGHTITVGGKAARAHLAHGDTLGACEDDSDGDDQDEEEDTTSPVISEKSATPTTTSATIAWTTDEASDSVVEYATESLDTASSTSEVSDSTLVTSHSLEIVGLTPETEYFYRVKSTDEAGNTATSSQMSFTTLAEPEIDETAPGISNVVATPTTTSATITWDTDEEATSKVIFAPESLDTASSTGEVSEGAFVLSHSLELTGLATSTEYFYRVESEDESNNVATSTQSSFTTLP